MRLHVSVSHKPAKNSATSVVILIAAEPNDVRRSEVEGPLPQRNGVVNFLLLLPHKAQHLLRDRRIPHRRKR